MSSTQQLLLGEGAGSSLPVYIEDVFSTYVYTGTSATLSIVNNIDLSTKGGLTWFKQRTEAGGSPRSHYLFDTARGVTKYVSTDTTASEATTSGLTAFNANGFTIGSSSSINSSVENYVSWTFRKQAKFFDVVTYTGNGTSQNIAHNLGSTPGFMLVKRTSGTATGGITYHTSLGATKGVVINLTTAATTNSGYWNNTSPTSTEFTVGGDATTNASGSTYVAYLFAHNAGGFGLTGTDNVITCGTYVGTGNTGNAVTLGYEPQWLLTRATSATGAWYIVDNMRSFPNGGTDLTLLPNNVASEGSRTTAGVTPTGFVSNSGNDNTLGVTYIYVAIRRGPMKVPTDATKVFVPISGSDVGATSNFPVDFFIDNKLVGNTNNSPVGARLTGAYALKTTKTDAAQAGGFASTWAQSNTTFSPGWFSTGVALYGFARAPSFMDVVCYAGTGSAKTVSHNLGATPELMIVKSTVGAYHWIVYSAATGNGNVLELDSNAYAYAVSGAWNNTSPTSSVFTVGTYAHTNNSGSSYNAYLFATCAGVSKVGSYIGTGATQTISCGFAGGARFVLIKRTDSPNFGDWYVWDTARGMVSGTDPSLLLNSIAAEVNANSVYTTTGGFQIVSTAAGINASGGSYIFLAIA